MNGVMPMVEHTNESVSGREALDLYELAELSFLLRDARM